MADDLVVRRARPDDTDAILELLCVSLGWDDTPTFRSFYAWKHDENPFGESERWVALDGDALVGFRAFLRWDLERAGARLRAVRAVDTATAPAARGRGIFRRLTMLAVEELTARGLDLVFNTPNTKSAPGYLTMGWQEVGVVPRRFRPVSLAGAVRVAREGRRSPGTGRFSEAATLGSPAAAVLDDVDGVLALLASRGRSEQLRTAVTPEYLRWRHTGAVPSRAVVHPDGLAHGVAFVRVRAVGTSRIAFVGDLLVPDGGSARAVLRRAAEGADADVVTVIGTGARVGPRDRFLPFGMKGQLLMTRALATKPPTDLDAWALDGGALELL